MPRGPVPTRHTSAGGPATDAERDRHPKVPVPLVVLLAVSETRSCWRSATPDAEPLGAGGLARQGGEGGRQPDGDGARLRLRGPGQVPGGRDGVEPVVREAGRVLTGARTV